MRTHFDEAYALIKERKIKKTHKKCNTYAVKIDILQLEINLIQSSHDTVDFGVG